MPEPGEPTASMDPQAGEISRLAEHLFRQEAGKLVSVLTGIFGIDRLQMAEDVVQEALIRALQTWPYYGIPKNPAAWLTQTAKNLAVDLVRREKLFSDKQPQISVFIEQWASECNEADSPGFETEIRDGRLRLMFACCHPSIPVESQSVLALKTLCGFSPGEIARAFLTTEAAVAKRLTRARQRIRELNIPFEIPAGTEAQDRLDGVLQTLYLLFNEGYKASSGDTLIRDDLCREAIRLAELLACHPAGDHPRVHALVALMFLNAARAPARQDLLGNILRLEDQDRSRWDASMIRKGFSHLARSASGQHVGEYHVQAAIAAIHCAAPNIEATDWRRILQLYGHWLDINPSPVIALNRAVAIAHVHGPRAALDAIEAIGDRDALESYYLFHAVIAEFQARLNDHLSAALHLRKAIQLADLRAEQLLLEKRLRACESAA